MKTNKTWDPDAEFINTETQRAVKTPRTGNWHHHRTPAFPIINHENSWEIKTFKGHLNQTKAADRHGNGTADVTWTWWCCYKQTSPPWTVLRGWGPCWRACVCASCGPSGSSRPGWPAETRWPPTGSRRAWWNLWRRTVRSCPVCTVEQLKAEVKSLTWVVVYFLVEALKQTSGEHIVLCRERRKSSSEFQNS